MYIRRFWWLGLIVFALFILGGWFIFGRNGNKKEQKNKDVVTAISSSPVESKTDCPNSLTFDANNSSPVADYAGIKRQISNDEATLLHNGCPNMIISASSAPTRLAEVTTSSTPSVVPSTTNSHDSQYSPTPAISDSPTPSTTTSSPTTSPTTTIPDTLSIITPYFNDTDITSINEAYSKDANNPYWGFSHPGIDFMTEQHLVDVRASASGTVSNITIEKSSGQMGWHAGFCIQHNNTYGVCYNLETFSSEDSLEQEVRDNFLVKQGQAVNQGDLIARLVHGGSGSHIDFGVTIPGDRVCPESYFTDEAKTSVLNLIHKDHPNWPMCY